MAIAAMVFLDGRTVPSFRIVLAEEKQEWKPFRDALDKIERKEFDEMWDIPRNHVSACSNSVQLVPLQPILISILGRIIKVVVVVVVVVVSLCFPR